MIVCWVVCAVSVAVCGAVLIRVNHNKTDYEDLVIQTIGQRYSGDATRVLQGDLGFRDFVASRREIVHALQVRADRIAGFDSEDTEEKIQEAYGQVTLEQALQALAQARSHLGVLESSLEAVERQHDLANRTAARATWAGGLVLLILLWNIICYIGHWIWMGRKVE